MAHATPHRANVRKRTTNASRLAMTRAALALPRRFASMRFHDALRKNQRQRGSSTPLTIFSCLTGHRVGPRLAGSGRGVLLLGGILGRWRGWLAGLGLAAADDRTRPIIYN